MASDNRDMINKQTNKKTKTGRVCRAAAASALESGWGSSTDAGKDLIPPLAHPKLEGLKGAGGKI